MEKKKEATAISRILFSFARAATICLMRPVPGIPTLRAAAHPLFGLAPGGACLDGGNCFRSRRALTPPFHPYRTCVRRFAFCCAFLSGAYRPRHPFIQGTPCSAESGLSSSPCGPAAACRRLPRQYTPGSRFFPPPSHFFQVFLFRLLEKDLPVC